MSKSNTRSDEDRWDVDSGVGRSALLVAQGRAIESSNHDPLIVDEFAASFLRAAGTALPESEPGGEPSASATLGYLVAVRTRFFDDFVQGASEAGIEQFVVLAAGLDARAFRMAWVTTPTVFEIDQPAVIDFKNRVLTELGATPTCDRRTIGIDLRGDWVAALRASGFDSSRPTAWLAEGLTPYLHSSAQEQLFDRIASLSAPTSRLAFDIVTISLLQSATRDEALRDIEGEYEVDIDSLVYAEDSFDDTSWLAQRGWELRAEILTAAADRYKGPVPEGLVGLLNECTLKTAALAKS